MSNLAKGSFLTLFGAACWGLSGCVAQYLFTRQGMDSAWLTPLRLGLAGIVLCAYYLVRDRRALMAPWHGRHNARDLVIYGLAGVSGCQFLYFLTIQLSNAGMATILQNLSPVMILLVTCLQRRRRPSLFEVLSVAMALGGVLLLTTHGRLDQLAIRPDALVTGILSGVCVVIYTMWPRRLQRRFATPILQGWAFLMGGAAFSLVFRPWQSGYRPTLIGLAGIAVVVLIGNVLAFCCYMQGVKWIGAQRASLYSFAEPVTAAALSTWLLGSPFTGWDALGFACIFIMLVLLSVRKEPARARAQLAKAHS